MVFGLCSAHDDTDRHWFVSSGRDICDVRTNSGDHTLRIGINTQSSVRHVDRQRLTEPIIASG